MSGHLTDGEQGLHSTQHILMTQRCQKGALARLFMLQSFFWQKSPIGLVQGLRAPG
jgi:hypothetical protein